MVSPVQRLRSLVAERTDRFVLARFDELSRRGDLGRDPESVARAAVDAFVALYDDDLDTPPSEPVREAIKQQFHRLYYHEDVWTWRATTYRGATVWKCPIDLWAYQELLHEVQPDLIVETGTAHGGSALYLADLCELLGRGHVVSIDIVHLDDRPQHPRLTYLTGSSVAPEIVEQVRALRPASGRVVVILDSDHRQDHVLAELETWASWVPVGSYLIVEDTNVNGHPVFPDHGAGPMEALETFLERDERFESDLYQERRQLTFNPRGFLKRVR